jgi:small nuclear ribonucleoprotein (snRNP)-like protein
MSESRPFDTLSDATGSTVLVELKNGTQYTGELVSFDKHINNVLRDATERDDGEVTRDLGTVFIRGDNVNFIAPEDA